jgi:phosphatidylserine/phosphatidylglycerophosphate/cardiolipin synthase-like enzyme
VDEKKVFTGSSNIGFTSLTTSADFELDLIIESPEFARHTLERNSSDRIYCSQKLSPDEIQKIHLKTRLLAPLQSNFKFLL